MEIEQELRLLTGEVVYHLRTALEYLAYHLVWRDQGSPFERSKFPIVAADKGSSWPKVAKLNLPGVTSANLERIRLLQPFVGCDWTAKLVELSNMDKHRSPIKVRALSGAEVSLDDLVIAPDPKDPDWYVVETVPTLEVQTHDGKPLHAELRDLCVAVNQTLVVFADVLPGRTPGDRPAAPMVDPEMPSSG